MMKLLFATTVVICLGVTNSFSPAHQQSAHKNSFSTTTAGISKINDIRYTSSQLQMVDDTKDKLAKMVSGEELETMLQEWDQPLVVDAYATWYVI